MASGPHQQQTQDRHMQPQQQNHRMQFVATHTTELNSVDFNLQQQQLHHNTTMLPNASIIPLNHNQAQMISVNPHQHQPQQHRQHHNQQQQPQQQQQSLMGPVASSGIVNPAPGNQSSSHIQQQQQQQQQQQESQLPPSLLSPRPPSLTPNSTDQTEQSDDNDVIDNVISLHNDYSDTSAILPVAVDSESVALSLGQQHIQHQLSDNNFVGGDVCLADNNQFSSSSEDLINLLSQYPLDTSDLRNDQQLDQDEKIESIEKIRKQLMSCEVQSEHQNTNSMSPIINQSIICQNQQTRTTQLQSHDNAHQQQVSSQLISQIDPVITHHQITPTSGQTQHQMSNDQSLLHGSYSNIPMSSVPVSTSGQSYAPQQQQQQQQHVTRISQSNPMPIVNSSPTPSWQQPQLSPYSPQNPHNNPRTPSNRQGQQHHSMQHHQTTTSPQMQQMHHPLQQRSPSQSVSPPVTTEPSPVVKKNPLLNAQLVNTRSPSITPTRFMNSQANVLNQNPILNAKLSQSPFVSNNSNNTNIVGSPVNSSLNQQSRFMQQNQQTNFSFDINHQQQNAQQGHMNIYGLGDQQQQQQQSTTQVFRTTSNSGIAGGVGAPMNMGNTSPSGGNLSQQVKQEIRRKVQQPKQQHQTTSLLKQLLSDDTK